MNCKNQWVCLMKTKQCSKCRVEKSLNDFYKKKSAVSGISSWCKMCELTAKRAYHKKTYVPHPKLPVIKDGTKKCSKCGTWKPFKAFSSHSRCVAGVQSMCRECTNTMGRVRYSKFPEAVVTVGYKICTCCKQTRVAAEFNRQRSSKDGLHCYCRACLAARSHGLTALDIEQMRQRQNNCCKICAQEFEKAPYIDHNHATGKVRGLLCLKCNSALGFFQDNPNILKAAAQYLLKE